ncbi:MAG: hypothetical protein IJX86_12955 [Lachnospiraceae bacterium]|nr:hypothetical protein [Lachnospiraceae bacterium]
MSGKFMKVRKICVSTLTMLIIASQLCGCASSTQKEMLNMYNNNQSIMIELAEPISQEQGTEVHVEWTELAALNNYEAFRMTVDDALGITAQGENGKNGVLYVDLQENHTNNSTLFNAFANQKFRDNVWNNSDASQAIIGAAQSIYTDVESDKAALLAGYNAYYNLLNDSEPGYANMYSTITRLEAMSMIFKADTPVYEIAVNEQFASAVENDTLAPYAQELNDYSFLKADNLSLDGNTANGTITRAEFVYMIVQRYFADDYAKVTGKESCYSDAKNGGDVATEIGLITTDKETGAITVQNRCESYELSYCIQVEKAGMPEELYRAMVVAQQRGLITGSECRWSDGLIKGEALTILTNAYNSLETQTNADRGAASGEVVVAIDFKDIDPAIHATYNAETGEITVDDTMVNTLMEKSAYFDNRSADNMRKILPIYLEGYFTGRYDGNAWYQFVLTGDTSYLNFEISDAELILRAEQEAEEYVNSEEFKNSEEYDDYQQAQDELEKLKAELEALKNGSTGSGSGSGSESGSGNTGGPGAGNTGGGSAPEMPSGGGHGSDNSDPWAGDGTFIPDEDPGDGGDIVGPDIIWN